MASPMQDLEHNIFRSKGTFFEGEVFSVLKHSPYVVRSFEFAVADMAIDCTNEYPVDMSFADRFVCIDSRAELDVDQLCLGEIKSTTAEDTGDQKFLSSLRQHRRVGYYIGIRAADPDYVELIPNYNQDATALLGPTANMRKEGREAPINSYRVSRLPHHAHGMVDQTSCPHRMPIALLPEAIRRVRACARSHMAGGSERYINPWNNVSFPDWIPLTTSSAGFLRPKERSDNYTAYEHAINIRTAVVLEGSMTFDFVMLQPSLADFQLIVPNETGRRRQCLIQHKVDGRKRAMDSALDKVWIARHGRHFFHAADRFDFLFYEFEFSAKPPRRFFFFIPERYLPDEFFDTPQLEASFESAAFRQFRIDMDGGMMWAHKVRDIIERHPQPRSLSPRPLRSIQELESEPEDKETQWKQSEPHTSDEEEAQSNEQDDDGLNTEGPFQKKAREKGKGRAKASTSKVTNDAAVGKREYEASMTEAHRRFFFGVMDECAERKSGLVIELARNHPAGDFVFCSYTWTDHEQAKYRVHGRMPLVGHQMPSITPVVPVYYYTRHAEAWFQGLKITGTQMKRLDSSTCPSIVIWGIGDPDTANLPMMAAIPSEDIQPTASQRDAIKQNSGRDHSVQFDKHTPYISDLLTSTLYASEYALCSGPALYLEGPWARIWNLLMQFTGTTTFDHPQGFQRNPSSYRLSLQSAHQMLERQVSLAAGSSED